MTNTSIDNEALSPSAAARRLGVGRTTIYQLLAAGDLRSFKVGRARRIPTEDIEALRQADAALVPDPVPHVCCCAMLFRYASLAMMVCRHQAVDRRGSRRVSEEKSA